MKYVTFDFPQPTNTEIDPETEESDTENRDDALEVENDIIRKKADAFVDQLLVNPDMNTIAVENIDQGRLFPGGLCRLAGQRGNP